MNESAGRPPVFNIQDFARKYIPFSSTFVTGQKSGRGQWLTAVFGTPNVDTTFVIALGHIPSGYVPYQKSVAMDVYNGTNQGTDWTTNAIVLRASAAGTARLWIG